MNSIIQRLIRGNGAYAEDTVKKISRHMLAEEGQEPKVLIITCSDSRVIPEEVFSLSMGEALVMRNAGGRITEDVLEDVKFFTHEFASIQAIILMGHSQCGYYEYAVKNGIGVEPLVVECLKKKFSELELVNHISKMKVAEGLVKLEKIVPSNIKLRGAMYYIRTGIVEF